MTRPKLLLADDSVTIRKVVELTFSDEGIDVTTVADGASAMTTFVELQPDIVLVDVGLDGTNGYQICEMIKADESTSDIPVLLLVGSFEPFDQEAAERSGADGFLTKPFHSIRDLVNRVHELLGTQTAATEEIIDFETTIGDDDNRDIDDLYARSFEETIPIGDSETIAFNNADPLSREIGVEREAADDGAVGCDAGSVDASHHSVDEWLDDEMIETATAGETPEVMAAEHEAVAAAAHYADAPAGAVDVEPVNEFDWSPAAIVTAADETQIQAPGFGGGFEQKEPATGSEFVDQHPMAEDSTPFVQSAAPEITSEHSNGASAAEQSVPGTPSVEPSEELIELVMRRVIERLSDRAVREVAQEAVPRIAEKLMREALEEERKS